MHVVFCPQQLDGIAAAAILFRAAKLQGRDAKLGGIVSFDNAQEQFAGMRSLSGDLIFIVDFLPDNLAAIEPHVKAATVSNRIAYWNSHHPHSAEDEAFIKKYAHTADLSGPVHYSAMPKTRTCAAELACARFLPTDAVAKDLARLAHDIEFWERTDTRAARLADIIAAGFDVKELVQSLAKGVLWSERFELVRNDYLAKKKVALQGLLDHVDIRNVLNHRFGFTLAPTFLPSADAGQHVLDNHAGIDVTVVLYRNGRMSLRKRDSCPLNLAELAKLFGGGGHAYAAGARLAQFPAITRENFSSALFAIDQRLKAHLVQ